MGIQYMRTCEIGIRWFNLDFDVDHLIPTGASVSA